MGPLSILDEAEARALISSSAKLPCLNEALAKDIVEYRARVAQLWIEEDIRRGILPINAESFSELHDHVDANMYLIDEEHPAKLLRYPFDWDWDFLEVYDHYQVIATGLSEWLASGRNGEATDYLSLHH